MPSSASWRYPARGRGIAPRWPWRSRCETRSAASSGRREDDLGHSATAGACPALDSDEIVVDVQPVGSATRPCRPLSHFASSGQQERNIVTGAESSRGEGIALDVAFGQLAPEQASGGRAGRSAHSERARSRRRRGPRHSRSSRERALRFDCHGHAGPPGSRALFPRERRGAGGTRGPVPRRHGPRTTPRVARIPLKPFRHVDFIQATAHHGARFIGRRRRRDRAASSPRRPARRAPIPWRCRAASLPGR